MPRPARPRRIPLIGWSTALHRFRELAESGELGNSVLIVGEPGVGKRTLAETYKLYFRSRYKESLQVVPIDPRTTDIPDRCIAITAHPPAYGRPGPAGRRRASRIAEAGVRHLDSGERQPIPDEECSGEPLSNAVVARFAQTWYLPPLRRRIIDALALLHFCGTRLYPRDGPAARAVDSDLIHQLLLDRSWLGNADGLLGFLRSAADGGVLRRGNDVAFPRDVGLPKHLDHGRADWEGAGTWDGRCDVPFEELPKVAAAIFAASFFTQQADPPQGPTGSPFPHLGSSRLWASNPYWPAGVEPGRATKDDLMRAMAGPAGVGPLPGQFAEELSSFAAYGATVESLRAGFAVTPDSVPDELLRLLSGKPARATRTRAQPKTKLTPAEKEICDQYLQFGGNQAAIAAHRGCSRSAVNQLIKKAKAKYSPELWEDLYERKAKRLDKKVIGKRPQRQSLPKNLADRDAHSYEHDFDEE